MSKVVKAKIEIADFNKEAAKEALEFISNELKVYENYKVKEVGNKIMFKNRNSWDFVEFQENGQSKYDTHYNPELAKVPGLVNDYITAKSLMADAGIYEYIPGYNQETSELTFEANIYE